ncbi:MAG: class I SAM-dependent methyltransferase [Candidatus Kapabacteria bacterium]|nr:class I SAM-dependent methyltransferase [Ignavibacteriota bacterium]MCW5884153.1 class I SAM-dependent methyltransferase [Candidatus Kapabacteria bacterium]
MENKNHWYDGFIYDKFVAPFQDAAFKTIFDNIEQGKTLLDVGTGTGRFAFQAAKIMSKVDAVDLSIKNINVANGKLLTSEITNLNFYHQNVLDFLKFSNEKYDYITMSYVIHEIDNELREEIMLKLADSCNYLVIAEFLHPRPKHIRSLMNEVVEFFAGAEHYRNFKNFIAGGGSIGLANRNNLQIIKEIKNNPITSQILFVKK